MQSQLIVAVVSFQVGVAVASAQSLADVARQEEARRRAHGPVVKIYTNDDLVPVPAAAANPVVPADATSDAPPSAGAGSPSTARGNAASLQSAPSSSGGENRGDGAAAATEPAAADANQPVRDEKYWRSRMQALRTQLEQDRSYADAVQTRINVLTMDFTNRDDPAQRARIGVDRQKALADLERLKTSIENGTKAIANLEEEARRAGAPAGWLR